MNPGEWWEVHEARQALFFSAQRGDHLPKGHSEPATHHPGLQVMDAVHPGNKTVFMWPDVQPKTPIPVTLHQDRGWGRSRQASIPHLSKSEGKWLRNSTLTPTPPPAFCVTLSRTFSFSGS